MMLYLTKLLKDIELWIQNIVIDPRELHCGVCKNIVIERNVSYCLMERKKLNIFSDTYLVDYEDIWYFSSQFPVVYES